jgi:hypothetical protein
LSDTLAKPDEEVDADCEKAGANPTARDNDIAKATNTLQFKGLYSHR